MSRTGRRRTRAAIDWRRLTRRGLLGIVVLIAVFVLGGNIPSAAYGFDFHGGLWKAGQDLLAGRPLYVAPHWWILRADGNAFVTPPPLAILAIPFSVLPFRVAVTLWNVLCVVAFAGALRLLGVRDRRVYAIAMCSYPFVSSLICGQPDGLFALMAAAAWRWRESWPGALSVGALIAAKVLAWPLVIWLLVTRRVRCSLIAAISAAGLLVGSWALTGFRGLLDYPRLLSADARAFEARGHSVVAAAMWLGASAQVAQWLAIGFGAILGIAVVRIARRSDAGWFTAAIAIGLFISPIVWQHYLVLLFVPLAISHPRLDRVWLLSAAFWFSPTEITPPDWQILLVLITATLIMLEASRSHRQTNSDSMSNVIAGPAIAILR